MSEAIVIRKRKSKFKKLAQAAIPEGGNLDLCLTCSACVNGCPATGINDMDPRKFVRMVLLGLDEEVLDTPWIWWCSMCQRCKYACPMGVDIGGLVYTARQQWAREKRPKGIQKSCDLHLEYGNSTGIRKEDWVEVCEEIAEETRQGDESWRDLQAPVDKKGAQYFLNQNAREPTVEPEEMAPLWKILHEVGIDWTYSSKFWDAVNYCMFSGDDKDWKTVVTTQAEIVNGLGCKTVINTECGHAFYSVYAGLKRFNIAHDWEFESIITLYARWIREGRLKVDPSWNKDGLKVTCQDPCNLVRKGLGDVAADDLRFVVRHVVGEGNFVDMYPNKSNNYCCGGGGGYLQSGFVEKRRAFGRIKFDQIQAAGADIVVTPCHNCHSQIEDICRFYGGKYKTVQLWTLILKAMVRKQK
ncbi:MAG: (Fe-S)-binding protein [Candidatus Latescibacterota bacterium]